MFLVGEGFKPYQVVVSEPRSSLRKGTLYHGIMIWTVVFYFRRKLQSFRSLKKIAYICKNKKHYAREASFSHKHLVNESFLI